MKIYNFKLNMPFLTGNLGLFTPKSYPSTVFNEHIIQPKVTTKHR